MVSTIATRTSSRTSTRAATTITPSAATSVLASPATAQAWRASWLLGITGWGWWGSRPRATIYGFNLLAVPTDQNVADAAARELATTAVSSNSWGYTRLGLKPATRLWELAVEQAITNGYGGKGVFLVRAAGNDAEYAQDVNFSELRNYYGMTTVCAVTDQGVRASYSERGASLWICAPSGDEDRDRPGIATTINDNRYRDDAEGTSSATPMVAGVAALLRAANPSLSWRDVKLILAASARTNDADHQGWEQGARKYGSDTERYWYNHDYGFGVLDAAAALDLADGWHKRPRAPAGNPRVDRLPGHHPRRRHRGHEHDHVWFRGRLHRVRRDRHGVRRRELP